jgi:hypothetical protein
MKTQTATVTKIASINRLSRIASLAALLILLCFASGAWAQTKVTVDNTVVFPVFTQGTHLPVEYHFGPGQIASIAAVPYGSRLVIEHVNIQTWSSGPWFVELAGTGPGVYSNTAFLLSPVTFPGGRSFGVVSSTGKMFALTGTVFQFNFSNSTTNNTMMVPANTWVEVWGYIENANSNSGFTDDF